MSQPFAPYPFSIGPKTFGLCFNGGHAGPAVYAQLADGGDVISAKEFGLEWIERMQGGLTSNGLYRVEPVNPVVGPVRSLALRWTVVATGAEVATAFDLSASKVNLSAIGTA